MNATITINVGQLCLRRELTGWKDRTAVPWRNRWVWDLVEGILTLYGEKSDLYPNNTNLTCNVLLVIIQLISK